PGHRHRLRTPLRGPQTPGGHPAVPLRPPGGQDPGGTGGPGDPGRGAVHRGTGPGMVTRAHTRNRRGGTGTDTDVHGRVQLAGPAHGGTLRAEATLAGANLVYVLMLGLGGVLFPTSTFPGPMEQVVAALPITALSSGLRSTLVDGSLPSLGAFVVLAVWAGVCALLAARLFRWD